MCPRSQVVSCRDEIWTCICLIAKPVLLTAFLCFFMSVSWGTVSTKRVFWFAGKSKKIRFRLRLNSACPALSDPLWAHFFSLHIFFFKGFLKKKKHLKKYHEHPSRLIHICLSFNGCMIWFGHTIIYSIILLLDCMQHNLFNHSFVDGHSQYSRFCQLGKFSTWKLLSVSQLLYDKKGVLVMLGQAGDTGPAGST